MNIVRGLCVVGSLLLGVSVLPAAAAEEAEVFLENNVHVHTAVLEAARVIDFREFDAGDIAAYARYREISAATARLLWTLERYVPPFADEVREALGDHFAGIWVNYPVLGQVTIAVTSGGMAQAELLRDQFSFPSAVNIVERQRSRKQLELIDRAIRADAEVLAASTGLRRWSVVDLDNVVEIGVLDPTPDIVSRYHDRFGEDSVRIVRAGEATLFVPPVSAECRNLWPGRRWHCNPLRGGTSLHTQDFYEHPAFGGAYCSIGFNAHHKVYTHVNFVLTAGHCLDTSNYHAGERIGPASFSQAHGNVDAKRIEVRGDWSTSRWVFKDNARQAYAMTSVYRGGQLPAGVGLCAQGGSTGGRCGSIRHGSVGFTYSGTTYHGMIGYTMCMTNGDSGGAVNISSQALGLIGGEYDERTDGNCYGWATYVKSAESALQIWVTVS